MSIELTTLVCACRAKMMGFNAARLEWNVAGLAASPKSVTTSDCDIATAADIESSLLPPTTTDTPQPTGNPTLPQSAPSITGDTCSADLPTNSTTDRFVYMANYLCGQVCLPAQLACRLTGTAFVQTMEIVPPCLIVLNSVYLMHAHHAARDSICMQGVYNCTMSAAILTMVFHSVQAIQVSVTYSAPVCLLQGFYVALVYHSVSITYGGDTSIQKETSWIADWVSLVQQVQKSGACEVCALMLSGLCFSELKLTYCQVCARTLSGLCFSELKPSACQVCARTLSGLWFSVPSKLSFQHVRRSGLPPWEAPIMTAEKRKLSFSFLFFSTCASLCHLWSLLPC